MQNNQKNYNEGFTEIEIKIIEDQNKKQMQEIDPLFLGYQIEREYGYKNI